MLNNTARVCALLGALTYVVTPPAYAADKVYAVIFDVTLNADGKVGTLTVNKVIDPASGTTDAVPVSVPDAYITAARAFLLKRTYPPEQGRFSTYTFFEAA